MLKYSYICVSIALVRVNIVVVKHHDQKQLGKQGRVYLPSCPDSSPLREAKAGTQIQQEPAGKSWSKGNKEMLPPDLLHMPGSTCFLMLPKTISPGVSALTIVTTQNRLSLCNQSLIKNISCRLTDNPVLHRQFLSWSSLLSGDSNLHGIALKSQRGQIHILRNHSAIIAKVK